MGKAHDLSFYTNMTPPAFWLAGKPLRCQCFQKEKKIYLAFLSKMQAETQLSASFLLRDFAALAEVLSAGI